MPELKSMKMSEAERKEYTPTAVEPEKMEYPYGLCLELNDDTIEKIGLSSLPSVGDTMSLTAKVKVRAVAMNDHGEGKQRNVSLQITDMALEKGGDAKSLYEE